LKKQEPSSYADASFIDDPKLKDEGKKWIRHFGCAGCHEISGLEDEGRIGTELTSEGSKPIERLDFALLTETAHAAATSPSQIPTISRAYRKVPPSNRGTTQRILRAQARRAQYLGPRQNQTGRREAAHAQSALDQGTSPGANHFPDGQPGKRSSHHLSIQAAGLSPRHSRRLVDRSKV